MCTPRAAVSLVRDGVILLFECHVKLTSFLFAGKSNTGTQLQHSGAFITGFSTSGLPHTLEQVPLQYLTAWTEKVFDRFQHPKMIESKINPNTRQRQCAEVSATKSKE